MSYLIASILAVFLSNSAEGPRRSLPGRQLASICFQSGEQESGMNKICYYDCISGTVAITIGAFELCPLTIDRD